MTLRVVTPTLEEPVTVAEAKSHERVDTDADDTLVGYLITAAREYCEVYTNRTFVTTVYDLYLDSFQTIIRVPKPRLQSVTSIKYYDSSDTEQTLDSDNYQVDTISEPGRICSVSTTTWPTTYNRLNAVTIRLTQGYGDARTDVPESIRQAINLLVGHWYENREAVMVGAVTREIQFALKSLLWSKRVFEVR